MGIVCDVLFNLGCVCVCGWLQNSKPTLITALEDCVYNFVWFTAAACPLNSTEHGDCKVNDPRTGESYGEITSILQSWYSDVLLNVNANHLGHNLATFPAMKPHVHSVKQ